MSVRLVERGRMGWMRSGEIHSLGCLALLELDRYKEWLKLGERLNFDMGALAACMEG